MAKLALSQAATTEITTFEIRPNFQVDGQDVDLVIPVTRAEFESRIEPLIDRSVALCRKLVERHPDVSEILLVGGPTVMPIVGVPETLTACVYLAVNSMISPTAYVLLGSLVTATAGAVRLMTTPVTVGAVKARVVKLKLKTFTLFLRQKYQLLILCVMRLSMPIVCP